MSEPQTSQQIPPVPQPPSSVPQGPNGVVVDIGKAPKTTKSQLKRAFITIIICSLTVSALVGIFILLRGKFDDTDGQILLTTLMVGIFSVTSLANIHSIDSDKNYYRIFSWISIVLSVVAFILIAILIWDSNITWWKPAVIFSILAIASAHISLLLPKEQKKQTIKIMIKFTIGFIVLVTGMLVYLTIGSSTGGDFFFRLLGVFAILDVLGTIISPIASKFSH